jgi:signal transduction histidine kinase
LLDALVSDYRKSKQPATLQPLAHATLLLRPKAMRRAMSNIIDNAIRYGEVCSITSEMNEQYYFIYVDDKGPGIDDNMHEEVFRPFTRLDSARNADTSGAGLGLAITRDIINSHGGDIYFVSPPKDQPYQGLRVAIRLPL